MACARCWCSSRSACSCRRARSRRRRRRPRRAPSPRKRRMQTMMPESSDQLLLPVNPLFIGATLLGARWRSSSCRSVASRRCPTCSPWPRVLERCTSRGASGVGSAFAFGLVIDVCTTAPCSSQHRAGSTPCWRSSRSRSTAGCCGSRCRRQAVQILPLFLAAHRRLGRQCACSPAACSLAGSSRSRCVESMLWVAGVLAGLRAAARRLRRSGPEPTAHERRRAALDRCRPEAPGLPPSMDPDRGPLAWPFGWLRRARRAGGGSRPRL